jgi:Capsular polysaccharide biosynthesis protein
MIDLHCHILPSVDDGANSIEESILMANKAIEQGITHLLCSPHHMNGRFVNYPNTIIEKVRELQAEIQKEGLDLTLLSGQEVRLTSSLPESINNNEVLFIDDNKYFLVEFPASGIPVYAKQVLWNLTRDGYCPILVHPERNIIFRNDPNELIDYLDMGILTQVTAPSITGVFGKSIQKTARKMLKHNMVHMVASDAHGLKNRDFYLKEAYQEILKVCGADRVTEMKEMAVNVIKGEEIRYPAYHPVVKRKMFFFK